MALKILLADDSMTAQNMGKKILVDAGYEVVAVSNGAAAIKKIASDHPDVVILDFYMPGYQGDEVCERVKASPETAHISVLLTVGKMEPFNPEKANKVRADGVLIKPFEATDLITAVQSIGSRKAPASGPTPILSRTAPAPASHETTVRVAPPMATMASVGDTLRIPTPSSVPRRAMEETLPVPPPKGSGHDDTIRLTPEQIRAFQDATYKDWVKTTEPSEVPTQEMAIEQTHVMEAPVLAPHVEEPSTEVTATPMFGPAAEAEPEPAPVHEVFAVKPPEVHPEIPTTSVMHEPAPEAASVSQPFFAVEQTEPSAAELPSSSVQSVMQEPVFKDAETSTPYPVPQTMPETLAQLLVELEPEGSREPVTPAPVETAPELEINSPIHLQENVEVAAEPSLVTSDDDMSQFTTKFGVDKPEEVAVGNVAELSPEQLAAITAPMETSSIEHATEPVAASSVELAPVLEVPHNVLEEVQVAPEIPATEASIAAPEPIVAFVPGIEDTQGFGPYVPPVLEPAEPAAPAYEHMAAASVEPRQLEAAVVEPIVAPIANVEAAEEVVPVPQPEPLPEFVQPSADAVATQTTLVESEADGPVGTPVIEASAAAAVAAAGAATGYFIGHSEAAPAELEPMVDSSADAAVEPTPVEMETSAPDAFGDAALAEELAAALARKEAEEKATSAAEAVTAENIEPAIAAALETQNDRGESHTYSDSRLSSAIARAIEHLKPQLITEILKELTK